MRWVLVFISAVCLSACAPMGAKHNKTVHIEGLRIENQSAMWVSAARLLIPATGGFVSCGNIPSGSMCSTGFPETEYAGNPVEITWSQAGRIHSTGEFVIATPDNLDPEKPAMVKVIISGPGSAGAGLIQQP